jgi:hypothetical protein
MKLDKLTAIAAFSACVCVTAHAGEANPVSMANQAGFFGCDSLIAETFMQALKSSERRFSVDYFNETATNNVDLTVTFGSTGDTVLQSVHFQKSGGYCYSVGRSMISEVGNCAGLLNKDPNFKYTTDTAGALWSKNRGNVDKIFIQSGNACTQVFIQSDKQKASR